MRIDACDSMIQEQVRVGGFQWALERIVSEGPLIYMGINDTQCGFIFADGTHCGLGRRHDQRHRPVQDRRPL